MSNLDGFLSYLRQINEGTIELTAQDYTKICAIRDQVTDLAKHFTNSLEKQFIVSSEPNYGNPLTYRESESAEEIQYDTVDEYKIFQYEDFVNEMIVKRGNKWMVKDKKGKKTLGTHSSHKKALAQLRAIEISKAGR